MESKIKVLLSITILVVTERVNAQNSSSIGWGYDFINKKPTVDAQFNRESAADATNKYDVFFSKGAYHLNPAAEVHVGSGTQTSTDNVIIGLNSYFKNHGKKLSDSWPTINKFNILSPQLASDKNFKVYQGLTSIGYNFTTYNSSRDKLGYIEFNIGAEFDAGLSKIDSLGGTKGITRIKGSPSFAWSFTGKKSISEKPTPLDSGFYYRMQFAVSYIPMYFLKQDIRIIDKKSMGYFSTKFSYRFYKTLQVTLNYKHGRLEPLYKKVNNVNIGLAIVTP